MLSFGKFASLYQVADAFVCTSEKLNQPMLEAAACGVPLVAARDFTTPIPPPDVAEFTWTRFVDRVLRS